MQAFPGCPPTWLSAGLCEACDSWTTVVSRSNFWNDVGVGYTKGIESGGIDWGVLFPCNSDTCIKIFIESILHFQCKVCKQLQLTSYVGYMTWWTLIRPMTNEGWDWDSDRDWDWGWEI